MSTITALWSPDGWGKPTQKQITFVLLFTFVTLRCCFVLCCSISFREALLWRSAKDPAYTERVLSAVENKVEKSTWYQKKVETSGAIPFSGNTANMTCEWTTRGSKHSLHSIRKATEEETLLYLFTVQPNKSDGFVTSHFLSFKCAALAFVFSIKSSMCIHNFLWNPRAWERNLNPARERRTLPVTMKTTIQRCNHRIQIHWMANADKMLVKTLVWYNENVEDCNCEAKICRISILCICT